MPIGFTPPASGLSDGGEATQAVSQCPRAPQTPRIQADPAFPCRAEALQRRRAVDRATLRFCGAAHPGGVNPIGIVETLHEAEKRATSKGLRGSARHRAMQNGALVAFARKNPKDVQLLVTNIPAPVSARRKAA